MKTPSVHALLVAGLCCAFTARAGDDWHAKPSSEWNEKEVRQILEHSPWSRRVSVLLVRPDGDAKACLGSKGPCVREDTFHSPDPNHGPPSSIKTSSGRVSGEGLSELRQDYPGGAEANTLGRTDGVAGVAVVRWASSRTVHEALARVVPPSGKRMDAEQLAQLAPADAYVIYVDLRVALGDAGRISQFGVFTEQMARRSFLLPKSSGQRIPAVRVAAAPLPEFDDRKELALAAYYIFFPREQSGHATVPARETQIHFEYPLAPVPIRADFKLSQMSRGGSPDF